MPSWTEVEPGAWERTIGENEKFVKLIGDRAHGASREHWSITASGTFSLNRAMTTSELSSKCIDAWLALRFHHPSIACTAEGDTLSYLVPSGDSARSWVSETFTVHDMETGTDDVIAAFKPSRYTTAHFVPREQSILLHFSHWRTDGYGSLQLVGAFMEQLCRIIGSYSLRLNWGEEVVRLTPSVEEVLDLPAIATEDVITDAKEYVSMSAHMKTAVGVELMDDRNAPPAGTRRARLSLGEVDTTALLNACSAQSISLLSAVHASCAALTYLEAASDARNKPYTSTMRFSLRPHLPEPYCSSDFAASLYTGGYMFRIPASQPWLTNAKQYENEYQYGITSKFLQCRRQYAVEVMNALQQNVPPPNPPQSEVDISAVGDAEALVCTRYARGDAVVEVRDVSFGVETLSKQTYCFLWIFRGRLELSLVYNEAYYDDGRAAKMVRRLVDILRDNLHEEED